MTDDIDNDGTTLHESGGVVQPTDAQLVKLADMLWEQGHISCLSRDTAVIYARAVLCLMPTPASNQCRHGVRLVNHCESCAAQTKSDTDFVLNGGCDK